MNIALCDDDPDDRAHLVELIQEYATKNNLLFSVTTYDSGEGLLAGLKRNSYSILFLDVYMGGITGLQTAETIRKTDSNTQIIFTTSSTDCAVSSYRVRAAYYLLKPVSFSWLAEALNLCKMQRTAALKSVELPVGKINTRISIEDILYAEIFQKCLTVYTVNGKIQANLSMESFEIMVMGDNFLRCHRSYIVNMAHVEKSTPDAFVLDSGQSVQISRPNKAVVKKLYSEYVLNAIRS